MKEIIVSALGANSPSFWKVSIVSLFVLLFSILSITSDGNSRKGNTLVVMPQRKKNKFRAFLEQVFFGESSETVEITGPVKLIKPILTIHSSTSNSDGRGMEIISYQNACLKKVQQQRAVDSSRLSTLSAKVFPSKSHVVHVTSLATPTLGMPTEVQVRDLMRQVEQLRRALCEREIDLRTKSELAEESQKQQQLFCEKLMVCANDATFSGSISLPQ